MAQKRKMDTSDVLDEGERDLFYWFQNSANHLSHFYTQSINHQKLAFQAGEQYAYVQLHKWMFEKLQEGRMVTVPEILTYLKGEINDNVSDMGPEQGASGSQQHEASVPETPTHSAQAGPNQDGYLDMQMGFSYDEN